MTTSCPCLDTEPHLDPTASAVERQAGSVLVVDDDKDMVALLARHLSGVGCSILTASGGSEALELIRVHMPGVVLTDWIMPEMDGLKLCRAVRDDKSVPFTYFIVLTADTAKSKMIDAFNADVDDFLFKPADVNELRARVRAGQRIAGLVRAARNMKREITVRTQAEEATRTILNNLPIGVMIIGWNQKIRWVNSAALKMMRYDDPDEIVGHVCHKNVCPAEKGHCPIINLNQTVDKSERVLLDCEGRRISILKTVLPISLYGENVLLEAMVDITDRKKAEQQLALQQEHLEQMVADRSRELLETQRQLLQSEKLASLGQLSAGVAHEINTPTQYVGDNLRALLDFFGELKRIIQQYHQLSEVVGVGGQFNEEIARIQQVEHDSDLSYILEDAPVAISQALDGVQRIAQIVRAMRDFSHVDRGETSLADLNQALTQTLTVAKNEYKYVADVVTEFGEIPAVECYVGEINQVFLNLLVNAAHAIGDTGKRGTITIRTRLDGEQVEIQMADTGCGISPEIRERVYDPFFTTKAVGRGTGQGLAIAHHIVVNRHRGVLTFESEVGRGTVFTVRLPVKMNSDKGADSTGANS